MAFFIKKILIILAIIIISLTRNKSQIKEDIIIPTDSIRLRIVSNSNLDEDIKIKLIIKNKLEDFLYNKISKATNITEANKIIEDNIENINDLVKENIKNINFDIDYGINYFPSKTYKGIIYKDGYYKSLVITLGEGSGNNWWCVLFPPLCLIEDNINTKDVSYSLYIKRIIEKYK